MSCFNVVLMAITLGVNMIIRRMVPFFSATFWALSIGVFDFCSIRPSRLKPMRSLHPNMVFNFPLMGEYDDSY